MSPISLEQCQVLKEAGYPQDIRMGQYYYDTLRPDRGAVCHRWEDTYRGDFIAIPTLTSFLDWFVKFAERWAEKMDYKIIDWDSIILRYNIKDKRWDFGVATIQTHGCYKEYSNPSPLLAVVNLFMQMWKEMRDG